MTTCKACAAAQVSKHSGLLQLGCKGCSIRGLAKSRGFSDSMRAGKVAGNYYSALDKLFEGDVKSGHEAVKAEFHRMKGMQ